jgi:hypothetical protein
MRSESVRVTLRLAVYRQSVRLGAKPLETHGQMIFQLNTCGHSPYATSALTEDGAVVYNCCWPSPGPSPAGLMTTFYCLRFETPPTWRARSPYLYPPGTGLPNHIPSHWALFPSPFTTRRATVVEFDPASTPWRTNLLCLDT